MDHKALIKAFRDKGELTLNLSDNHSITLLQTNHWSLEKGSEWMYLLFDTFQIRSIAPQPSEVGLDLIEFASKPTIYWSEPNFQSKKGPLKDGKISFSIIKEPSWNKLLFQISQPVLAKLDSGQKPDARLDMSFPLFYNGLKVIYLGENGDIKILKN